MCVCDALVMRLFLILFSMIFEEIDRAICLLSLLFAAFLFFPLAFSAIGFLSFIASGTREM